MSLRILSAVVSESTTTWKRLNRKRFKKVPSKKVDSLPVFGRHFNGLLKLGVVDGEELIERSIETWVVVCVAKALERRQSLRDVPVDQIAQLTRAVLHLGQDGLLFLLFVFQETLQIPTMKRIEKLKVFKQASTLFVLLGTLDTGLQGRALGCNVLVQSLANVELLAPANLVSALCRDLVLALAQRLLDDRKLLLLLLDVGPHFGELRFDPAVAFGL